MNNEISQTNRALEAFDKLPSQLRNILNYIDMRIDTRYILGIYKEQGLKNTLYYLDSIGVLDNWRANE